VSNLEQPAKQLLAHFLQRMAPKDSSHLGKDWWLRGAFDMTTFLPFARRRNKNCSTRLNLHEVPSYDCFSLPNETAFGGVCATKLDKTNIRVYPSTNTRVWLHSFRLLPLLVSCFAIQLCAATQRQEDISAPKSPLTMQQVVARLVGMNLRRAHALHTYHGTRTYKLEYRGFPSSRSAEMLVDIEYRDPATKEFTIQSSDGSQLVIDKVFKKLLQAEQEAMAAEAQRLTALNLDNYNFAMVKYERTSLRSMYVLFVVPRRKDKFLFRGRIWVDDNDFAVVRLEAEPAKNPSFWTKSTEIEQLYVKVGEFWLPERNHSISTIRLGGRAELTIEYRNYQITASDPVVSASDGQNSSVDRSKSLAASK
jgi:hypothetical protein